MIRLSNVQFTKSFSRAIFLVFLIALILLTQQALAKTYYVDAQSGNDNNSGATTASPFRTIQKAVGVLRAGDTCLVQPGVYNETVYVSVSGISNSPIVFQANGAASTAAWVVRGDYVHILGFEVTGGQGIELDQASYCLVQDNNIHDVSYVGICMWTEPGYQDNDTCTHNTLKGNKIVRSVKAGIQTNGQNHLVENNDISEIRPDGDGIRFFGQNITFRGNYIHDLYRDDSDPHVDCFQTWQYAHDIIFEGNKCIRSETSGSNQIFMVEEQQGTVGNFTIRNNIFVMSDPGYCPVNIDQKISGRTINNTTIVNNTFIHRNVIGRGDEAIKLTRVNGATIKNNIFYNWGSKYKNLINVSDDSSNIDIGFNNVYVSDGNYPTDGPYLNDVWGKKPSFADWNSNDYHLVAGSAAINAGYNSGVANDYDGTSRPQDGAYDIGAFEFVTQGNTLKPPTNLKIIN